MTTTPDSACPDVPAEEPGTSGWEIPPEKPVGFALLAGVFGVPLAFFAIHNLSASVIQWRTTTDLRGHRLIGCWHNRPTFGFAGSNTILFEDGTGKDCSGVGNFDFRWRLLAEYGRHCRVSIMYSPAVFSLPDREWHVEFVNADTLRGGSCETCKYYRVRP